MTAADHTPSPATDGLRARVTALAEDLYGYDCTIRPRPLGVQNHQSYGDGLKRAGLSLRALLADPAPEAASRDDGRHQYRGGWCSCGFASCDRASHLEHVARVTSTPADLPVATGVTTEDEGCEDGVFGSQDIADALGGRGPLTDPAPVASAGDEGLSEEERELAEVIGGHLPQGRGAGRWPGCFSHPRVEDWTPDHLANVILASDWFAARVAEAEARALREAADTLAPTEASAWWVPARFLRSRADQIGATQ